MLHRFIKLLHQSSNILEAVLCFARWLLRDNRRDFFFFENNPARYHLYKNTGKKRNLLRSAYFLWFRSFQIMSFCGSRFLKLDPTASSEIRSHRNVNQYQSNRICPSLFKIWVKCDFLLYFCSNNSGN